MKKIILGFLLFLCIIIAPACSNNKKYLALGDSITYGETMKNPEQNCYPSIFAKKNGFELTNEAVSGDETSDLLAKIDDYNLQEYDLITLCIGANDVLGLFIDEILGKVTIGSSSFNVNNLKDLVLEISSSEEFNEIIDEHLNTLDSNLKTIAGKLKKSNAKIYIFNIYNPYKNVMFSEIANLTDSYVKKINEVIEANVGDFELIDLYSHFEKKNTTDNFLVNGGDFSSEYWYDPHPNTEGQKEIAKLLSDTYEDKTTSIILIVVLVFIGIVLLISEIWLFQRLFPKKKEEANEKTDETIAKAIENKEQSSRFSRK